MEINDYIKDSNVLYIYESGLNIYNIKSNKEYLIVFKEIPENFIKQNDFYKFENLTAISINDWFKLVEIGDIKAWECACLPKKYIIKEYVKLLLSTNPLQLRLNFDLKYKLYNENKLDLFELVKTLKFSNQIIENHKIVNFGEIGLIYPKCSTGLDWNEDLLRFKKYTDSILKSYKIKKLIENREDS